MADPRRVVLSMTPDPRARFALVLDSLGRLVVVELHSLVALAVLMPLITASEDKDMATMVSNWYHKWENDTKAGTEDSRNLETLYNRVVKNINDLATNLPD